MASRMAYGSFTLAIGSEDHGVDAAAYGTVLVNTANLIDEFSNTLETGARFEIVVEAERKGSHLADIVLQAGEAIGIASSLITPDNIVLAQAFARRVISGVAKCWEVAKKLGGEAPARVEQHGEFANIVINGDMNAPITIEVHQSVADTVLNNEIAKIAIANTFQALEAEKDIASVGLLDKDNQALVEVQRKDFKALSKRVPAQKAGRRSQTRPCAILAVNRQSFKRSKKSDFIYAGNEITATIVDENFWQAIDRGERFAKGDRLVTVLEIEQIYNESVRAWENYSYKILSVLEHRPRPFQRDLIDRNQTSKKSRQLKK